MKLLLSVISEKPCGSEPGAADTLDTFSQQTLCGLVLRDYILSLPILMLDYL